MNINIWLWATYTRYIGYFYDNAWFLMLLAGIMVGCFIKEIRIILKKNGFVMEIIAFISAYFAMREFPLSHNRMHVALQSAAEIIISSKTYGETLENYLNIGQLDFSKIAQILYYASEQQKTEMVNMKPSLLYSSFFETYDQITMMNVLGNVTKSIFENGFISAAIILIITYLILKKSKFEKYKKIICIVLLLIATKYCGAFIFVLGVIVAEGDIKKQIYKRRVKSNERKVKNKSITNEKLDDASNVRRGTDCQKS